MSEQWPRVRLAEVLRPVSREERVDPSREYRILGARWYASGLFVKDAKLGQNIKATKVYRVRTGDFVYNRLFAWKGSFAVASDADDGCYVSNEFPCFEIDRDRVLPGFIAGWFQREDSWLRALGLSSGATPTSRNRLKEENLLGMEIPLPPLAEQRRLVARLQTLGSSLSEVYELSAAARRDSGSLTVALAHRFDLSDERKAGLGWRQTTLGDVVALEDNSETVQADRSYPNVGIFSFGRGLFRKPPIDGALTSARALRRVSAGQFIYSRLFAFEGAYGVVDDPFDGSFVSNEYPTFRLNPNWVLPSFLLAYFQASHVWRDVAIGSKGLGDRRQRVQPDQVLRHALWLPPLPYQRELAAVSDRISRVVSAAAESAPLLEAVMPAVLDRAFRGEL